MTLKRIMLRCLTHSEKIVIRDALQLSVKHLAPSWQLNATQDLLQDDQFLNNLFVAELKGD